MSWNAVDVVGPGPSDDGSGYQIGDGFVLTAGHVVFRYNGSVNNPDVETNKTTRQYRPYQSDYLDEVKRRLANIAAGGTGISLNPEVIEGQPRVYRSDTVVIEQGGNIGATDQGLIVFLNASDLSNTNLALATTTTIRMVSDSHNRLASINSASNGLINTSDVSVPGDSGGAFLIEVSGRAYVIGTVSGDGGTYNIATYFRPAEWVTVNDWLASGQSGNVTTTDPTNMIVGSAGGDFAQGSFRADIIFGKGGGDTFSDGDVAGDAAWGDDQIFGGADDDTFIVGNGNDLIHGGDFRAYTDSDGDGTNNRTAIKDDGKDTLTLSSKRSKVDPGVELRIGGTAPAWVYGDTTDQAYASYIIDRHDKAQDKDKLGTDAVISIEDISLTGSDDVLTLNEFSGLRFAQFDSQTGVRGGGVLKVTFGDNDLLDDTDKKVGDLIDSRKLNDSLLFDLAKGKIVYKADDGSDAPSRLIEIDGVESVYAGSGEDEIRGSDSRNRLDGGKGIDKVEGGGGDDYIVSSDDRANDLLLDGGDGTDTLIYKYESGHGRIIMGPAAADSFGLDITIGGIRPFGSDTLKDLEKAAVEAGDGTDVLIIAADGVGVDAAKIDYIDLGTASPNAFDTIDLSSWTAEAVKIDVVAGTVEWSSNTISVRNAGKAIGGAGDDQISAKGGEIVVNAPGKKKKPKPEPAKYVLVGGAGADSLTGSSKADILYSASDQNPAADDNAGDTLIGGAGLDTFYVGAGDLIAADENGVVAEKGERVIFNGVELNGGIREGEAGTGGKPYKGTNGTEYIFNSGDGGLTVQAASGGSAGRSGFARASSAGALTIESFQNGDANIYLRDKAPDVEEAEKTRDPLIIDIDRDGSVARSLDAGATYFDIDKDGFAERVAWANAADGFLALDKNADGIINDAGELFGSGLVETQGNNQVRRGTEGFADLRQYDLNSDSVINSSDAVFSSLRVWVDADSDGITDAGELRTLDEIGVSSISLNFTRKSSSDTFEDGSFIENASVVQMTDGSKTWVYDAYLAVDHYDTREDTTNVEISSAIAALPFLIGRGEVSDLDVAMTRDPALEEMVRAFADLTAADAGSILALTEKILLRWTGADEVETDARGPNINARWLVALEKVVGNDFYQAQVKSNNPRGDAATILTSEWQKLLTSTAAQLLGQTDLGAVLTPGLAFKAAAFFAVEEGSTLTDILASLAVNVPTDIHSAMAYWHGMLGVVEQYEDQLGVTHAQVLAAANPLIAAAGIPFSASALSTALFAGEASGAASGLGWGAGRFILDDLIIADSVPGPLTGGAGNDTYVVNRFNGSVIIDDNIGSNQLYLTDLNQNDVTLSFGSRDGITQLILSANDGTFSVAFGVGYSAQGAKFGIETVRFADGETATTAALLDGASIVTEGGLLVLGRAGAGDTLSGGGGDDLLVGFGLNDIYSFGAESGDDIVSDFHLGSDGDDKIVINAVREAVTFSLSDDAVGGNLVITLDGSDARLTIVGQRMAGGQRIERFEFAGGLVISADDIDALLNTGTAASDILKGSQAADILTGLGGDDTLRGNKGADQYIFGPSWGQDVISDLDTGNNIVFQAGISSDDLRFERTGQAGSDLVIIHKVTGDTITVTNGLTKPIVTGILFAGGPSLSLAQVIDLMAIGDSNAILGSNFNDYLQGNSNDEVFYGLDGDDQMIGGGGINSFHFSAGRDTIEADGIDTLVAPTGARAIDFRILNGSNAIGFRGYDGLTYVYGGLDFVRFDDGSTIDLTVTARTSGTTGDDILFNTDYQNAYFFGGLGDDIMIGGSGFGGDQYFFESDFGNDVIYDQSGRSDLVSFDGEGLGLDKAVFRRSESDLSISFLNLPDTLTIEGFFWRYPYFPETPPEATYFGRDGGSIEYFSFTSPDDGYNFLYANDIIALLSARTAGDDLVMSNPTDVFVNGRWQNPGLRDGGAGNDTLYGGEESEAYVFAAGYGHDVIKDSYYDPSGSYDRDKITFTGLASTDVEISRSTDDIFSIIFTIKATGETLTIDGTPDDGFNGELYPNGRNTGPGGITIETFVFTDTTLNLDQVTDLALSAGTTEGNDEIWGINSFGTVDALAGDDRIHLVGGSETIVVSATSGHDVVSRDELGRYGFQIRLDGISAADVVIIPVDEVDGIKGDHVRIETGPDSSITVLFGRDIRTFPYYIEGGYSPAFSLITQDGSYSYLGQIGRLVANGNEGTQGADNLQDFSNWGEATDSVFDPLEGDDRIFGDGGQDTVIFGRGYGVDRYWGNIAPLPFGEPQAGRSSEPSDDLSSLIISMRDGVLSSDVEIKPSAEAEGLVELRIIGTTDRLIFDPLLLDRIEFSDVTWINGTAQSAMIYVDPFQTASGLKPTNETIVATGGSIELPLAADGSRDSLLDTRFNAHVVGTDQLQDWSTNTVLLDGASLDDFEFIRDADNPDNLLVRNIVTGSELLVENQFALGEPALLAAWSPADGNNDGSPDWSSIDANSDGNPDFAPIDSTGDGVPDWVNPDFNGDGESDWISSRSASIIGGYALDSDLDGIFEEYVLYNDAYVVLRDTNGDGIPDEYSSDGVSWTAAPLDGNGQPDWTNLDVDANGVADIAFLDTDGDLAPNWVQGSQSGTQASGWTVRNVDDLYDAAGNYLASRTTPDGVNPVYFRTNALQSENQALVARDTNDDLIPDEYGVDINSDGIADERLRLPAVVAGKFILSGGQLFSWAQLLDRVTVASIPTRAGDIYFNVLDVQSEATDNADRLILYSGNQIDSLAGDDTIISLDGGATLQFGTGDGNDVFGAASVRVAPTDGSGYIGDRILFDSIIDPNQLRFLRGGADFKDLIVEIRASGERLTISNQLGPNGAQPAASASVNFQPVVTVFEFSSGLSFGWNDVFRLIEGADTGGANTVSSGISGGVLDGGAGNDGLNGGSGDDIYIFGRAYDEDRLSDTGGRDAIQFGAGITEGDVFFSRTGTNGNDLLIEVSGTDRLSLTVSGEFGSPDNRVETFVFDDGTVFGWRDVQQVILENSATGDDDQIIGFASDDRIAGKGGNDELTGAGGNDRLYGGLGRDTAVFSGIESEYEITTVDGVTTVRDLIAGRDGIDTLVGIEDLAFLGESGSPVPVAPPNNAPEAQAFEVDGSEDTDVIVNRAEFLSRISDTDGDILAITALDNFEHGRAWFDLNGNVRFRPDANFNGLAGFDYIVSDGNGGQTAARVSIELAAVNDQPVVAIALSEVFVDEDRPVDIRIPNLTFVDIDGDILTLSAKLANGDPLPSWLSVADGNIVGTPPANFNGVVNITVSASDGTASISSSFALNISPRNDAPMVVGQITDMAVVPGASVLIPIPAALFEDVDGDAITVSVVLAGGQPLPAWLTFNGENLTGTVPANFSGTRALNVVGSDGKASAIESFSLTVTSNNKPVVANPLQSVSVNEDQSIDFTIPADTFADPDGDVLVFGATQANGSSLPGWLTFANGRFTGTPPANFNGSIALVVTASDSLESASSAFDLIVQPINDAPDANNNTGFVTNEDTPLTIATSALLANDSDVDGDALTISAVTDAIGGTVTLIGNQIQFAPTANFYGDASFTYSVSDPSGASDTALVSIRVYPVNDAPIVMTDIADVIGNEDQIVDFTLASDAFVDVDGDMLSYSATLANGNALPTWLSFDGQRFAGNPPANFNGVLTLVVTASDGVATAAQQFSLTLTPQNDAPVVAQTLADQNSLEDQAISITLPQGAFADVDGDTLSLSAKLANGNALPAWLLFANGQFTGTPPANFNGMLDIAVTANDGALTVSDVFRLTIESVNDAPVVSLALADASVAEDSAIDITLPTGTFTDIDGDTLALSARLAGGGALPLWLSFAGSRFTGTPPLNFNGFVDVEVTASDGSLSASDVFRLTITPVNDTPVVAIALVDRTSLEDTAIDFTIPAGSFADVDNATLIYSARIAGGSALPSWLNFDAGAGRFTGTPPLNFNGFVDIEVTASDGSLSTSDIFRLSVTAVNDAPVVAIALVDRISAEDGAIDFTLPAGSFTDVDNAALTYTATLATNAALPSWLSFNAETQRFTGTPPANFNGFIDVRVTASDGALSVADDFRLNVTAVNDAPILTVALADRSSAEDTAIDFTVPAGSFTDVDNVALTYASTLATGAALPSWLSFNAATQRFTGTPPANFNGFIDVRVTASDGMLNAADDFRLTVTPVNDAPVALNDSGFTATGGNVLVIQPATLLANDSDPDGNVLTITAVGNAVGGTVALNAQGQVVYTASAGYQGTGSFSYTVSDGSLTATAIASIQVTSSAPGWVYGTPGNDSIYGSANLPNRIDGLAGNDTITGGSQNDELVGGAGNDNIYAGAGSDIVSGGDGDDTVTGDAGNDTITGGLGADKIYGGLGDDIIDAGDGNDTVTGDDGNDNIIGGNGDDLLYAGAGNDSVDGGAGNDTITGDAGTDTLVGGTGNDNIYGGDGNDSLSGGDGADKVYGDAGDDLLSGGAGNDIIDGNAGIDTIDYSSATTAWTVNLATNSATSGTETDTVYNMENVISGSGNDILTGTTAANILTGGAGNDTLTGGLGDDTLAGGTGADIAVFAGVSTTYSISTLNGAVRVVDNAPTVDGNDGTDTISGIEQLRFKGGTTVNVASPIILDLDGNGVKTVSAADSNARYDLDGDGLADDTSWIGNTEGFLFLDRDGNGTVTNAGEFSFIDDVVGAKSDLEGLRAFDSNNDGILSSLDVKFAEFKVWQDRDGDGAAEAGEILSLTQASVRSIKLTGTVVNGTTQFGDVAVVNKGSYTRTNGATMEFLDAALTYFSAATNMPVISVQSQRQTRKSDKYRISFAVGAMTLGPKNGKGQIDPRAGALGASNLMTFKNANFGLLSPIILDLDGDGVEMKSIKKSKASFDMNGDGIADDTGWTGTGDGFLVIDRNNDGKITHASELSFAGEDKNAKSDLEALAALDSNGDRVIDAKDARFKELKVWVDADSDGVTDAGELKTLEEVGITAIGLSGRNLEGSAKIGDNVLISTSTFTRSNGSTGTLGNAALAYKPGTVSAAIDGIANGDGGRLLQPDRLIAENSDFDPSDTVGAAYLGKASNGLTTAEQAVAILSGTKSGGGFLAPLPNMYESGPAIVNIFDYYEQPSERTTDDATTGNEPTSLRLADAINAPAITQDLPTSVRTISIDDVLLTPHSSPDPSARLLAIIAQDMAAFGARSGENDLSWRRDGAKPIEYFA